jgi:hypothetical protein
MKAKYINDCLNEKFSEESDPIEDMSIGIKSLVLNFLNDFYNKNDVLLSDAQRMGWRFIEKDFYDNSKGYQALVKKYPSLSKKLLKKYLIKYLKSKINPFNRAAAVAGSFMGFQ